MELSIKCKSVVVVVVCLLGLTANATVYFNDGGVHDIDYYINDWVQVDDNTPGEFTTFNLVTGGMVDGALDARDNSRINIYDGSLNSSLWAHDSSHITITGGTVVELIGYHSSQILISGGSTSVFIGDYSRANITGGSISIVSAKEDSHINLSGGLIEYGIHARENSQIVVRGTGFNYPLGEITVSSGTLTGTLANGDPIDNNFQIGSNASIVLAPSERNRFSSGW